MDTESPPAPRHSGLVTGSCEVGMIWGEWGAMCYRPYINTRLRKCRGIDGWKVAWIAKAVYTNGQRKGPRLATGPFLNQPVMRAPA